MANHVRRSHSVFILGGIKLAMFILLQYVSLFVFFPNFKGVIFAWFSFYLNAILHITKTI